MKNNKFVPMSAIEDNLLIRLYEQNKHNLREIETEMKRRKLLK